MNLQLFAFVMRLLAAGVLAALFLLIGLIALSNLSTQAAELVITDEVTGCQYVRGRDGRVYPRTDEAGIHHLGCRSAFRQQRGML